jgi:hypothetical protein
MPWDKTLTYNHGNESTRELHVLNVYADPDFIADIERIAGKDGSKLFADLFAKPNDLAEIAEEYLLTLDEIMHFIVGVRGAMPLPRDLPFRINWDDYDNEDYLTVTFDGNIKKKDFDEVWNLISRKQKSKRVGKQSRNKPLVDDKLVYAVFKQLQKRPKPTFAEIHGLYDTQKLSLYDKKPRKPQPPVVTESAVTQRFDELRLEEAKRWRKDHS